MNKLFFDIETIPAEKEKHGLLKQIYEKRIKDGKVVSTFEDFVSSTSLDGTFGRIICISYAINDDKVITLSGKEEEILKSFWEIAKNVELFIGFNVLGFDLKFIHQRSVIHNIKPSIDLTFAKYRNYPVYDVMQEWVKWDRNLVSLDTLAKALSIPSSKDGGISGKDVARAYTEGRVKEICEYCEKDVEVTRKIYKRLTFSH